MKILAKTWITPHGGCTIGVVVTENEIGERKLRVGVLDKFTTSEEDDAMLIGETGGKLDTSELETMISLVKENEKET